MNISKLEQRVLHVLAQVGEIQFERASNGKVTRVFCFTREGHLLSDCSLPIFERLKRRRFIRSHNGKPYRIARGGITAVRPQIDNQ
ncbi:MAG: YjhX family toxin [Pseudomonadota bacterium]